MGDEDDSHRRIGRKNSYNSTVLTLLTTFYIYPFLLTSTVFLKQFLNLNSKMFYKFPEIFYKFPINLSKFPSSFSNYLGPFSLKRLPKILKKKIAKFCKKSGKIHKIIYKFPKILLNVLENV